MLQKLIVIGAGMVGARLLDHLVKEAPGQFDIQVFNKELNGGYNQIMLSPVLAVLAGEKHLSEIIQVDTSAQTVTTHLGKTYGYERGINVWRRVS